MKMRYLILNLVLFFSLLACKSKYTNESVIKNMEAFLNKWELKITNGSLSVEDKVVLLKEMTYLHYQYQDVKKDDKQSNKEQLNKIDGLVDQLHQISIDIFPDEEIPFFKE